MAETRTQAGVLHKSPPHQLTPEQGIALWIDLMDTCEQFLLAGFRRDLGPDGDVNMAYRAWYARTMAAHDEMILHLVREFNRRNHTDAS